MRTNKQPNSEWIVEHVRTNLEAQLEKIQEEMDRRFTTTRRELAAAKEMYDRVLVERDRTIALAEHDRSERALIIRQKLEAQIEAVHHEAQLIQHAAQMAIAKQELATEKRFENVNEWRAQSADRERSQAEERAKLYSSFLLKEVGDSQFADLHKTADGRYEVVREQISALSSRLDLSGGIQAGAKEERVERRAITSSQIAVLSVVLTVVWILIAVLAIALGTHGFAK